jgi:hypothetical protein
LPVPKLPAASVTEPSVSPPRSKASIRGVLNAARRADQAASAGGTTDSKRGQMRRPPASTAYG